MSSDPAIIMESKTAGKRPVASSSIASPADTPEKQQKTLGGMPPEKSEQQIEKVNSPKSAPR